MALPPPWWAVRPLVCSDRGPAVFSRAVYRCFSPAGHGGGLTAAAGVFCVRPCRSGWRSACAPAARTSLSLNRSCSGTLAGDVGFPNQEASAMRGLNRPACAQTTSSPAARRQGQAGELAIGLKFSWGSSGSSDQQARTLSLEFPGGRVAMASNGGVQDGKQEVVWIAQNPCNCRLLAAMQRTYNPQIARLWGFKAPCPHRRSRAASGIWLTGPGHAGDC